MHCNIGAYVREHEIVGLGVAVVVAGGVRAQQQLVDRYVLVGNRARYNNTSEIRAQ